MNPGEDIRQRLRSSELSHSVTTNTVAGESSTIFEAPTGAAISEVTASFSKGAEGEAACYVLDGMTTPGTTGRFSSTPPGGGEVLMVDITVGFCDGISKAGSSLSKGAVGDGRSDGRTGGFEVLVADIMSGAGTAGVRGVSSFFSNPDCNCIVNGLAGGLPLIQPF